MKILRELLFGLKQQFSADNRSPRSFSPKGIFLSRTERASPVTETRVDRRGRVRNFFPNESGTVEVFMLSPLDYFMG